MPNALPHPCAQPLCPELVPRGERFCPAHRKDAERQDRLAEDKSFYWSTKWRKLRAIFLRAHPICICGRLATMVDHVVPIKQGGQALSQGNLQSMCDTCHAQKRQGERAK